MTTSPIMRMSVGLPTTPMQSISQSSVLFGKNQDELEHGEAAPQRASKKSRPWLLAVALLAAAVGVGGTVGVSDVMTAEPAAAQEVPPPTPTDPPPPTQQNPRERACTAVGQAQPQTRVGQRIIAIITRVLRCN